MGRPKRTAVIDAESSKKQKTGSEYTKILDSLDSLQDDDGTRACVTAFVKLPSKKLYADYYTLIENPISLAEIHKKVAKGAYHDGAEFVLDFQLMYDNAVKYNDPESWIVSDAEKLLHAVEQKAKNIGSTAEVTLAELAKMCGEILDEVINHEFPGEGVLSGPFMEDVDPDEYPDYFNIIETPMSFDSVRKQVRGSLFSPDVSTADNLQVFYDTTSLIFANAQLYNDPSSLIHEDSKKLQQVFEEKYRDLKNQVAPDAIKKEPTKLKLNLKPAEPEPPKKRRGRKPKKLIEEERRKAALEAAALKQEELDGSNDEESSRKLNATETNIMGKSKKIPPAEEVFIRRVGFTSTHNSTNSIINSITSQASQAQPVPTQMQLCKQRLFPDAPIGNAASFFDFQFGPLGFSTKAYSVTLPPDCSPLVNFKVTLHELIYNLKKGDLVDGRGLLKGRTEEDFLCVLYLNEEEVAGNFDMTRESDTQSKAKLLGLSYELKLNYGLNIISFELRLAPGLAKTLKREAPEPESNETAGRHTRHQLQQIKLNWEVEKFTIYVVLASG